MSLYKRGGVWWYDFQVRGVRIRESSGLTARRAAEKAEALRKAELIRNSAWPDENPSAPTLAEFVVNEFAAWSENQHRDHPSTHERYVRSVKVLIRFFGQRTLDTISFADVERFKMQRSKERRKNAKDARTVSPAAVNRDLAVLRILFNFAIRLGKARANPVKGVRFLPENNLQMRVLSWEEEAAYLAAASQPLRDIATTILDTGMRPGEVFHLRKEDVDLGLRFVRVFCGKTQFARRTIPLTRRVYNILTQRVATANSEWLFPMPRSCGRPLASVKDAHAVAVKRSAIRPPFRLYDLRHTALTRMAMAGIDLSTLRELAGHASVQMTMCYVHPTPAHKKQAITKLEHFHESVLTADPPSIAPVSRR